MNTLTGILGLWFGKREGIGTMVYERARVAMGLWFQGLSGVQGLTF